VGEFAPERFDPRCTLVLRRCTAPFVKENCVTQQTFDVLSPWAETDPQPLQGITPRLSELHGKRIGLFANYKRAAAPIQDAVEAQLRSRFGGEVTISRFVQTDSGDALSSEDHGARYARWLKEEVDAVIVAVGD
jgi:hypothetical protein